MKSIELGVTNRLWSERAVCYVCGGAAEAEKKKGSRRRAEEEGRRIDI